MPRTVECELIQDLVDACIPGDVVTVTGIIRGINTYMDIGGGMECIFSLYPLIMVPFVNPYMDIEMKATQDREQR